MDIVQRHSQSPSGLPVQALGLLVLGLKELGRIVLRQAQATNAVCHVDLLVILIGIALAAHVRGQGARELLVEVAGVHIHGHQITLGHTPGPVLALLLHVHAHQPT